MRGATSACASSSAYPKFQSTLLMRGATLRLGKHRGIRIISIHAPHARSDGTPLPQSLYGVAFQSTLLMRGATSDNKSPGLPFHISIHAPHARSDPVALDLVDVADISIHAPHARSDVSVTVSPFFDCAFQSTLLMRGATVSLFYIDSSKFHTPFSRTTSSTKTMSRLSLIGPASLFLCDTASHSITKSWVPQDHRYFLLQCVLSFLCSFSQADRSVNCLYVNQ